MNPDIIEPAEAEAIGLLVEHFKSNAIGMGKFLDMLRSSFVDAPPLSAHVHSIKWRVKHPDHLRDKLERMLRRAKKKGEPFDITFDNLFSRVNDLVGLRILHLYTRQTKAIHDAVHAIIEEYRYSIIEDAEARTWDDESRAYFRDIGIKTRDSESLYTSVHYVIEGNTRTKLTAEIQVRTLAEELWGEVDHALNYPHRSPSEACKEQLKALARFTSGCSRLVDSIFRSQEEHAAKAAELRTAMEGRLAAAP